MNIGMDQKTLNRFQRLPADMQAEIKTIMDTIMNGGKSQPLPGGSGLILEIGEDLLILKTKAGV